jgi:5'-3' exonuclease
MKTVIIDGNNLCYRALAIRGSREIHNTTEPGDYQKEIVLSIINGFLVQIMKMAERYNTKQFIFAWDTKPYHRSKLFPNYKSKDAVIGRAQHERRRDMKHIIKWGPPPHLKEPIFKLLKEKVLPKIGFRNIFWKTGFEADDIIASLVQTYSYNTPKATVVISSDRDLYQLLDHCTVYSINHKETDKEAFSEKYPFPPKVWPIFKSIVGDRSDAIPGVRGVGETLASKFLTRTLSEKSMKYKTTTSPESKALVRRNHKLMALPWPGVGTFPLSKDELSFPEFTDMLNRLAMEHLLTPRNVAKWKVLLS